MTLRSKLVYKYRETCLTKTNYELELAEFVDEFFNDLECSVTCELKDSGMFIVLKINCTGLDDDILTIYAKKFARELDVELISVNKETVFEYEDEKMYEVHVDRYELAFKIKRLVA